jgi:hypothetical protein
VHGWGAAWQVGSDPFTEMRQAKRERTKKNEKQQMGNLKVALKQSGPRALPGTVRLAASLPQHGKGRPTKRKDMEDDVRGSLSFAIIKSNAIHDCCLSDCMQLEASAVDPVICITLVGCEVLHGVCRSGWRLEQRAPRRRRWASSTSGLSARRRVSERLLANAASWLQSWTTRVLSRLLRYALCIASQLC